MQERPLSIVRVGRSEVEKRRLRLQQVSEPPMLGLAPPSTGCATSLRQFQEHVLAVCTSICLPLYRVQFLLFVAISARSVSNPTDASCPPSGSSPRVRLRYASLSFFQSTITSPFQIAYPSCRSGVGRAMPYRRHSCRSKQLYLVREGLGVWPTEATGASCTPVSDPVQKRPQPGNARCRISKGMVPEAFQFLHRVHWRNARR